ncbi:hypothetical protein HYALB_00008009 [Hymenoscyphus albidus]|uniref:Uncharacterized protein n=1 Tax=Hymenoscyphus albidus TaxID=595503 RepID=A0A9N9LHF1_9HELO|nr:hypothetical protein HYALB_00008009 [Hymenoscyphus albidus]
MPWKPHLQRSCAPFTKFTLFARHRSVFRFDPITRRSLVYRLNGIKELLIVVEEADACRYTDVTFGSPTKSPEQAFKPPEPDWPDSESEEEVVSRRPEFEWPAWFPVDNESEIISLEELETSWSAMTRRFEMILQKFNQMREEILLEISTDLEICRERPQHSPVIPEGFNNQQGKYRKAKKAVDLSPGLLSSKAICARS